MKKALAGLHALKLDRLAYRLWRYNPVALYRLYGHHAFDRRYGVHTRGYGDLRYEPTPAPAFHRTVAALEEEAGALSDLTFVDIGSGKGKVVLLAATHPFARVIGVELYREFHDVARRNLEGFPKRDLRAGEVSLVCEDASSYALPERPLALYFFNPFPEETLARVLANIEASLALKPRPLFVIYYAPIVFRDTPWDRRRIFDASRRLDVVRTDKSFTLYRGVSA